MTPAGTHVFDDRRGRFLLECAAVGIPALAVVIAHEDVGFPLLAALLGCVALPLRHWWPWLSVVLCLPGLAGGLGWPPTVVAMFALGRARPHVRQLVFWIAAIALTALAPVLLTQSLPITDTVLTVAFVLFVVLLPMALGALVTMRQRLRESLVLLRRANEAESAAKAETARAAERSRIAREIHDAVGHHVTLIAVEAAALRATTDDPEVTESARRVRAMAKEALEEMRSTLDLVAQSGQRAALRTIPDLVDRARESGVDVSLASDLDERADAGPAVGRAAYRVVQEALTNASKHAPGAEVTVRLHEQDGALRITVHNGASIGQVTDVHGSGSGLEGLSERVQMAGGTLEAGPAEDGGFHLHAVLPGEHP